MTGEGADNATPYFYHLDQIGTPLEITDATGAVAWSVDYHSYGNVAYQRKAEIVSPLGLMQCVGDCAGSATTDSTQDEVMSPAEQAQSW
ncbi:RHS domain-containing protein [Vibrio ruber]|uniref:RHS domain-containing protein n=1 Tax=Vibrio ruber TaxID=184755 RepID=UPI0028931FAF|nr:RHS domain-containing protein [Vibrio ruber]WNJ97890.1 RHS domain-containing protein [Vibrio ruber]